MTLQAINAQPLRQAVSFKQEPAAVAVPAKSKSVSTKAIVGWTVAGAAALGAIWWAVSAAKKGKTEAITHSEMFKTAKAKFDEAKNLVEKTVFKEGENSAAIEGGKLVKTEQNGVVTFQKLIGEKQDQKSFEYIVKKTDDKVETTFKDFLEIVEADGKKTEKVSDKVQNTIVRVADKEDKVLISEAVTKDAKTELYIMDEKGEKIVGKITKEGDEIKETLGEFEAEVKDGEIQYKAKEKTEAKPETKEEPKTETKEEPKTEEPKTEGPASENKKPDETKEEK